MPDRSRSYFQSASRVLGDLYKLVVLGKLSQKAYNSIAKQSPAKQQQALRKYSKKGVGAAKVANLSKQVREIARQLEGDIATHTFRQRNTASMRILENVSEHRDFLGEALSRTSALQAAMANFRYWDPATQALVVANPSAGTQAQDIRFKSIHKKIGIFNNYQVPCQVTVYATLPKQQTSITPTGAFVLGMADQGNPTISLSNIYLTDSDQFKESWKIVKSMTRRLLPGGHMSMSHNAKAFDFDPAYFDTHAFDFIPEYTNIVWVVRLEGVLGHDSVVTTEEGNLPAGVDIVFDTKFVMNYDAGQDLNDYSINDGSSDFTNIGLVSNKPVSDNQSYSFT